MKSQLIKEFNLPSYVEGKTFAEASKAIEKKFAERTDDVSKRTKEELMGRLAKAQEYTKMQESLQSNSQEVPDQMNGQVPEGFEEFAPQQGQPQQGQMAFGGTVQEGFAKGATTEQQGAAMAGMAGMAGAGLEMGMSAFGDTGVDTTGASGRGKAGSIGGGIATGAVKGAAAGAALGPWGAAVGGVIGGGLGGIGAGAQIKDQLEANLNAGYKENNQFTNDHGDGGPLDPPVKTPKETAQDRMFGGVDNFQVPSLNLTYPQSYSPAKAAPVQQRAKVSGIGDGITTSGQKEVEGTGFAMPKYGYKHPTKKVAADYMSDDASGKKGGSGLDYGSILRTAPIVSNALQLANLEKPNKITLDRLDNKYKPDYVDEKIIENRVQNEANNTTKALSNASNGSQGALRTNLLGSQLQKTTAMSDAFMKADGSNRSENTKKQEFDGRNAIYNQRQGTVEQQMNDRNDGAYSTAKSALQSQLASDIGNFGKEKVNMKQVAEMYGYKWDGTYMRDKDGKIVDPKKVKDENK